MTPLRNSILRMLEDLYPGARLVSTRRLRGGLAAQTHSARIELADGTRKTLVLRRKANGAERIPRHYRTLEVLDAMQVPAPKPIALDISGRYFDVPTMVIEHAGYPLIRPHDKSSWVAQLAQALHRVHQVTPENADLAHLLEPLPQNPSTPPPPPESDVLLQKVGASLSSFAEKVAPLPRTLVHDDYWPGNTVWRHQRLTAIIDWDGAKIGDPRTDVAQCRIDLTFIAGPAAADAFLREYEAAHGGPIEDIWYFDLACFQRGYGWFERWHDGYADIGIDWTSPKEMGAAARQFAARALTARTKPARARA